MPRGGGRHWRRSRWLAVLGAVAVAGGLAVAAWAFWTASASAGSAGRSAASSVGQGPTPSVSVTGVSRQVSLSWGTTTLTNGHAVDGYIVTRYPSAGGVGDINPFSSCAGTVSGTSCSETEVPPGAWKYTVTPRIGTNWKGPESTLSGTITIGAETFSIGNSPFASAAFTGSPATATATGPIGGFAGKEGLSYRLDSTSGPVLAGTPTNVANNGTASANVAIPKSSGEGGHSVFALGNAQYFPSQASAAIVIDTVAPTVAASLSPASNAAGWNNTTPVQVTLAENDPAPSHGNGTIRYTTDGSTPTGSSAVYSTPISVSAQGTTTIKFFGTDAVGNPSSVQTQLVKVDTVAPSNGLSKTSLTGNSLLSGNTLWYRGVNAGSFTLSNAVNDTLSGPASSSFAALSSAPGWSFTSSNVSSGSGSAPTITYTSSTFSWNAGTSSAPQETVTGFDIASNFTAAPAITFTNDSTGPSGGSADATGLIGTNGRYSTSTTLSIALSKGTDAGVGLAATGAMLQRESGTLSSADSLVDGSCSYSGGFTTIATDPTSPYTENAGGGILAGHCYKYQYAVSDLLGNQTIYTSGDIKVDNTAPSTPSAATLVPVTGSGFQSGSGSSLWYNPAQSGSFGVSGSTSDGESGIQKVAFPTIVGFSGGGNVTTASTGTTFETNYSWNANSASASPGAQPVVATDNAALTATNSSAFTLTKDAIAPTTSDNTPTGWTKNSVTVTLTPTDNVGGSGVANSYYSTDGSTPSSNSSSGTSISLTSDGIYPIKYFSVDKVANQETVKTAANQVMIDKTAPGAAAIGLAGAFVSGGGTTYVANGQTLTDAATDPLTNSVHSGVASVAYFYCAGTSCTPSTSISSSSSGPTYPIVWNTQPADGSYRIMATVTDAAGNTSNSAVASVVIDNTKPSTTDNTGTLTNGWKQTDQTVTLTATDPLSGGVASGVANTYYTKNGSTPTTASASGSSVALNGDGLYTVKYFSVDNVANNEAVKTAATQIRIDETAPSAPAIGVSGAFVGGTTTYIKNGQALTDSATDPTVNAASSGVSSVQYLYCAGSACTPSISIGSSATGPSYSFAWSSQPADGTYSITAKVTDVAGNTTTSAVKTLVIDNTAPGSSASQSPAANGAGWNNNNVTVTLSANDGSGSGVQSISYSESGAQTVINTTYSGPFQITTEGTTTITYFATDNVTNTETPKTLTIKLDKTPPTVSVNKVNGVTATFPFFTNAASVTSLGGVCESSTGATPVSLLIDAGASGSPTCTSNAWTQTLATPLTAEGTYTLNASQADAAGNTGTSGNHSLTIDRTSPTVTITNLTANSGHTVTASGTASHGSGDTLSVTVVLCKANSFPCSAGNTAATLTATVNGATGAWTTTSLNLNGTTVWARATQTDAAGNTGTSNVAGSVTA